MSMVMKIDSPSEAGRALGKMAAETKDAPKERANEKVKEYVTQVNVALSVLQYYVTISQRETRRHVLLGLSPRFRDEVHSGGRVLS